VTVPALEYHDTAVGRLPVGPAADAARAAAARPAADDARRSRRWPLPVPAAVGAGLAAIAAVVVIVVRRRSAA
jgi:hypothetical protein